MGRSVPRWRIACGSRPLSSLVYFSLYFFARIVYAECRMRPAVAGFVRRGFFSLFVQARMFFSSLFFYSFSCLGKRKDSRPCGATQAKKKTRSARRPPSSFFACGASLAQARVSPFDQETGNKIRFFLALRASPMATAALPKEKRKHQREKNTNKIWGSLFLSPWFQHAIVRIGRSSVSSSCRRLHLFCPFCVVH